MAAFVSEENQKRLWDVINARQDVAMAFGSEAEKVEWFRNFIRDTHSQIGPVSHDKLRRINRHVMQAMATDIRNRIESIQPVGASQSYESREREYKSLLETPKPPQPDFGENTLDTPVTQHDMDALMKSRNEVSVGNPMAGEMQALRRDMSKMQEALDAIQLGIKSLTDAVMTKQTGNAVVVASDKPSIDTVDTEAQTEEPEYEEEIIEIVE